MAGAKEIKTKIASVQSTQKITKAMEMVATSKMRKTQDRMAASRPYSETIRSVISHVSKASIGYKHPFLVEREVKKVGILVISTDRGMCGGLNVNLFKTTLNQIKDWKSQNATTELGLIGSKGISFTANMPTEEVFTLPHKDGINGVVYSTKALNYNGNIIECTSKNNNFKIKNNTLKI